MRIVVLWCGIVLGLLCGLLELPNVVLTALPVDNAPNSRLFGDGAWLLAVFLVSYTGVWLMRDHRSRYHEAMRRTAPKPKENGEKSADQPAEGKQVGSEAFDTEIRTLPSAHQTGSRYCIFRICIFCRLIRSKGAKSRRNLAI